MSDGRTPHVVSLGAGRYELVEGTRRRVAYAVREPGGTWVFLDGQVYVFDAPARVRRGAGRADDDVDLAAPMPATVVSVHVTPDQRVSTGDLLITLEAMKMEIAIKATRDGVVRAVHCRPGELVQPGVALLDVE